MLGSFWHVVPMHQSVQERCASGNIENYQFVALISIHELSRVALLFLSSPEHDGMGIRSRRYVGVTNTSVVLKSHDKCTSG